MRSKLTTPTRLSSLVFRRLVELNISQKEVAEKVGFKNQNMITMIKNGDAKLALDRVPAMAKALDIDPVYLFRLALEQTFDAVSVQQLMDILGSGRSANEEQIIGRIRELAGDDDPALTEELDNRLKTAFAST